MRTIYNIATGYISAAPPALIGALLGSTRRHIEARDAAGTQQRI